MLHSCHEGRLVDRMVGRRGWKGEGHHVNTQRMSVRPGTDRLSYSTHQHKARVQAGAQDWGLGTHQCTHKSASSVLSANHTDVSHQPLPTPPSPLPGCGSGPAHSPGSRIQDLQRGTDFKLTHADERHNLLQQTSLFPLSRENAIPLRGISGNAIPLRVTATLVTRPPGTLHRRTLDRLCLT